MTRTMIIDGGPFVIGRRLKQPEGKPPSEWEMLERGFPTREDAIAYVASNIDDDKYEWSIISMDELRPIDRRTIPGTSH